MEDRVLMGVGQSLAKLVGNSEDALQGEAVVLCSLQKIGNGTPFHILTDKVGLAVFLADVIDSDNVWVIPEPAQGLGLALDAGTTRVVQARGLEKCQGDLPAEAGIVGQVDTFFAAFPEETLDLVAASGEGGGKNYGDRE